MTTGDPHTSGLEQSVAAWRQWAAWGLLAVVAVTAVVALAWTAVHAAAAHSAATICFSISVSGNAYVTPIVSIRGWLRKQWKFARRHIA